MSGQDSHFADVVEERLRELYAIEQVVKQLKDGDTLYEEARERLEDAEQRFMKALSAAYNRVYFLGVCRSYDFNKNNRLKICRR